MRSGSTAQQSIRQGRAGQGRAGHNSICMHGKAGGHMWAGAGAGAGAGAEAESRGGMQAQDKRTEQNIMLTHSA